MALVKDAAERSTLRVSELESTLSKQATSHKREINAFTPTHGQTIIEVQESKISTIFFFNF